MSLLVCTRVLITDSHLHYYDLEFRRFLCRITPVSPSSTNTGPTENELWKSKHVNQVLLNTKYRCLVLENRNLRGSRLVFSYFPSPSTFNLNKVTLKYLCFLFCNSRKFFDNYWHDNLNHRPLYLHRLRPRLGDFLVLRSTLRRLINLRLDYSSPPILFRRSLNIFYVVYQI